jgi:hypothetical protein
MRLLVLLLLAAPLGAQQNVTIPPPDINVNLPPMEITNEITVISDEERLERIAVAIEGLAQAIAECGCVEQPSAPGYVRIGQGALVLAAFFIGFQLKGIKNNTADKPSDPVSVNDPPSEDYPSEGRHND